MDIGIALQQILTTSSDLSTTPILMIILWWLREQGKKIRNLERWVGKLLGGKLDEVQRDIRNIDQAAE